MPTPSPFADDCATPAWGAPRLPHGMVQDVSGQLPLTLPRRSVIGFAGIVTLYLVIAVTRARVTLIMREPLQIPARPLSGPIVERFLSGWKHIERYPEECGVPRLWVLGIPFVLQGLTEALLRAWVLARRLRPDAPVGVQPG